MTSRRACNIHRFNGEPAGEERLLALLRCTGGHVRALQLHQLPVMLDLAALFEHLPGCAALAPLRPAPALVALACMLRSHNVSWTGWLGISSRREVAGSAGAEQSSRAGFSVFLRRLHVCFTHSGVDVGDGHPVELVGAGRNTAAASKPMVQRRLRALALAYGRRAVSMDYERALFGMRLAACRALAQVHALPDSLFTCGSYGFQGAAGCVDWGFASVAKVTGTEPPVAACGSSAGLRHCARVVELGATLSAQAVQALPAAPGLARLDLSGNLLEDDKARLLADGLTRARVTHLSLAHNRACPTTRHASVP